MERTSHRNRRAADVTGEAKYAEVKTKEFPAVEEVRLYGCPAALKTALGPTNPSAILDWAHNSGKQQEAASAQLKP